MNLRGALIAPVGIDSRIQLNVGSVNRPLAIDNNEESESFGPPPLLIEQ
jgi:hypothetical protein